MNARNNFDHHSCSHPCTEFGYKQLKDFQHLRWWWGLRYAPAEGRPTTTIDVESLLVACSQIQCMDERMMNECQE